MPRDFAQIRQDMWADDDWRSLTVPAQHLYMLLLSDPKLSYCGVAPWHAGRIAQRSAETTGRDVLLAAAELSERFFVVIDEDTEEVLIRSYLKHDPLMKNPRLAVTMSKDFASVASNKIRAAIVWELQKLRKADPDLGAWEKPQVKTVLRQNGVNPREMVTDLPVGASIYLGAGLGAALPNANGKREAMVYQPPTTATATATPTATSSDEDAAPPAVSYPHRSPRVLHDSDKASMGAIA